MRLVCIAMHEMHTARIGIFGASGYAGIELTRLVASHGQLQLAFAASERHVGVAVEKLSGVSGFGASTYVDFATAMTTAKKCDAVLLATPAEVSLKVATELLPAGVRVIDLSGAFRLQDPEVYRKYYGHEAAPVPLLQGAVYGLPELFRDQLRHASLIANPGCYPTAATLPLYPLLQKKLLQTEELVVTAMSGASGAGRKASEDFSLVELHDNVKAYKVLGHQHTPEIAQSLTRAAGTQVSITFTPHLLPIPRGILCTTTARLQKGVAPTDVLGALRQSYRGEAFVKVLDRPEEVSLHGVIGTNHCHLSAAVEQKSEGRVVLVSAIDNLVKGAAGQALQNLNLALGFEQGQGLVSLRRFH